MVVNGNKGWLNIGYWNGVPFRRCEKNAVFETDFLELSFSGVGIKGSCPAEQDNGGCCFLGETTVFRAPERISVDKEFCDCSFRWRFTGEDAHGVSTGRTLPAYQAVSKTVYAKEEFTVINAARIPCDQVLGAYVVVFER